MKLFLILVICLAVAQASHHGPEFCSTHKGCCPFKFNPDLCTVKHSCRCDPLCSVRKDCCIDYEFFCFSNEQKKDCVYGAWSSWSQSYGMKCNKYKKRTRNIINFGNFNGEQCVKSDLVEYKISPQDHCLPILKRIGPNNIDRWENIKTIKGGLVSAKVSFSKAGSNCLGSGEKESCLMCEIKKSIHCLHIFTHFNDMVTFKTNRGCIGKVTVEGGPLLGAQCDPVREFVVVLERDVSELLSIKDRVRRSLDSEDNLPGEFDDLDQLQFEAVWK